MIGPGAFTELADGSRVVGHYRKTGGRDLIQGITVEKNGTVLFDSRIQRRQRLRIFPWSREWALEPREAEGEILVVGEG